MTLNILTHATCKLLNHLVETSKIHMNAVVVKVVQNYTWNFKFLLLLLFKTLREQYLTIFSTANSDELNDREKKLPNQILWKRCVEK